MKRWLSLLVVPLLLVAGYAQAQPTYMGDDVCMGCHNVGALGAPVIDGAAYLRSGHPWKLHQTAGEVPAQDEWPWSDVKIANGIPPVPPLPTVNGNQLEWSDVEYVIGNFFWKARFIDREGFIWTGGADDKTQWNLATQEFVPYHAGEEHPYNCGRCHTTGYDPDGNQNDLPGLVGTWQQDGVRCEACHGPGSEHVGSVGSVPPPGGKDCSDCHYRDEQLRMPWKGGFMRHHQQGEDFSHSPHAGILDCTTCHNPHRSVVYDDGGVIKHCTDCHSAADHTVPEGMENLDCTDCHMPKMGKSAVAVNEHKADVHGHLFQIMTDPIAAADNVTDGFWNQDANGKAFITLDYACLGCHIAGGEAFPMTLEQAAAVADGIHQPPNQAPTADPNGPYNGTIGQAVQFDGSGSSDTDGTIVSYEWDFGDGNNGTGVNPTHAYAAAGQYQVTLTVTDDKGAQDTKGTTADITETPPLPPGDTWVLDTPAIVTFQPFVGILKWVQTIYPDGSIVRGMGFEVNGIIYWWNLDPQHFAVFYGRIDRNAGFMTGIQISRGRVTFFTGAQP